MGFSRQEYWSGLPLPSPILYIENPKDATRKLLELINESIVKSRDIKLIHKNPLYSYTLTMENQKEILRNQSHSPLQQKELNI